MRNCHYERLSSAISMIHNQIDAPDFGETPEQRSRSIVPVNQLLAQLEYDLQAVITAATVTGIPVTRKSIKTMGRMARLLHQCRKVEQALCNAGDSNDGKRSDALIRRPLAKVRSRLVILHSLYQQSLIVPTTFESSIDRDGLRMLARHAICAAHNNLIKPTLG